MSIPTPPLPPEPGQNAKAKMTKEEVVGFLNDMIDALTWKRVGLMCMLAAGMIVMVAAFDNRTLLFNKIFSDAPIETLTTPWELSSESKAELTKLANSQPLIGGAVVMEINLKKNRRIVKFWMSKDSAIASEATRITATLLPQPFFNEDAKNNEQMLAVLNNQFRCVLTADTINVRYFANIQSAHPYICRLAVPPFAGQFAGFVSVFLTRQPTSTEVDALKIELTRISIETYLRDVDHHRN